MSKYESYTKDYLFALIVSGTDREKDCALKELCKRYKEINYYCIKKLAKQHTN